jgi:DNA-binding transcriptional regulator LsrR (DeoR family)
MNNQKELMAEIALLYYKKGLTQQEIANCLQLTRQTVSKLLSDAINENVVEIIIHNPKTERKDLELRLNELYGIQAVVCTVNKNNDDLRKIATTQAAISYLSQIIKRENLRIAISWGRSVQAVIQDFPTVQTKNHIIFPMFGATEHEQTYFLPNELAREFAVKLGAKVKFAWFPYKLENENDFVLFKRTHYFQQMEQEWNNLDVALIGIGNNKGFRLLNPDYAEKGQIETVIGDVSTHFFTREGTAISSNELTLRISREQLKNVKEKIAVAYGDDKILAILGAIRAGFVNTLITDEYTAKQLLTLQDN